MRQYVFDQEGLDDLLKTAYKSGFKHGLFRTPEEDEYPTKAEARKTAWVDAYKTKLDSQIAHSVFQMRFGDILDGKVGHIIHFDDD